MLFRKDMDPRCAYCQRGQQINEREVACLKRVPPRPAALETERLKEEDFSL